MLLKRSFTFRNKKYGKYTIKDIKLTYSKAKYICIKNTYDPYEGKFLCKYNVYLSLYSNYKNNDKHYRKL